MKNAVMRYVELILIEYYILHVFVSNRSEKSLRLLIVRDLCRTVDNNQTIDSFESFSYTRVHDIS